MKNKKCVVAGKKGASARWATRYDTIKELTKYYDKKHIDWFMEVWKTDELITLLQAILSIKK